MKKIFLLSALALTTLISNAQQVELNNVIINAITETQTESDGESNGMTMRGPGETKTKIVIKDSMVKTEVNTSFMNSIILSNTASKTITTLTESQGEKNGYITTEADRKDLKRRADSAQKANEGNAAPSGAMVMRMGGPSSVKEINYTADTKTINNIECKKALVTMKGNDGVETKMEVWYTDAYMLPEGTLNGVRGVMNFGNLNGLPIQYTTQRKMNIMNSEVTMTTTYTVTEIKQNAKIEAKEFEVPKGYKIKSYEQWVKDNPGGNQPVRMMMRAG
jgi:hypothetical protein